MSPRRRNPRVLWASLAAILVIAAGATWAVSSMSAQPASTTKDMAGNPVALDPGTVPPPKVRKQMDAVPDTGIRFRVPAVGLDVPVGQMSVADGQLTPPGFTSVYAVRNLGTTADDPTKGTVYVVTHSLRGGGKAPGNYLTDVATQTAAVGSGDDIFVGGTEYSITSTQLVRKPDIGAQRTLWADTPGRLAVITCLEKPSGAPSTDNLVIYAALVESASPAQTAATK